MNSVRNWRTKPWGHRTIDAAWLLVLAVISLWVFQRLGGFDLWSTVTRPDGSIERIAKTFGGVDHPFHATRADLLRRSMLDGQLLRWVSPHQGGYPVEFYPLGAPAFEVVIWALLLGTLPMMAAHKIAIIVIFLLPAAGFLLLSRLDKLPLGVGVLALVFHLSARGWWWSGGYMELVDWGLVSSFLAMTAVLLFLPVAFPGCQESVGSLGGIRGDRCRVCRLHQRALVSSARGNRGGDDRVALLGVGPQSVYSGQGDACGGYRCCRRFAGGSPFDRNRPIPGSLLLRGLREATTRSASTGTRRSPQSRAQSSCWPWWDPFRCSCCPVWCWTAGGVYAHGARC